MARNPQTDQRIKEVRDCLLNQMDRRQICEKFRKIWNLTDKAIDHYIREAKKEIAKDAKKLEARENERLDGMAEKEVYRKLTIEQKFDVLHKIALGEITIPVKKPYFNTQTGVTEVETVEVEPDFYERMKAIEIDNKMSGDNAPDKLDANVNHSFLDYLMESSDQPG